MSKDPDEYMYDEVKDELPMFDFFDQVRREEKALEICKTILEYDNGILGKEFTVIAPEIMRDIRKLLPQKGEKS